MGEVELRRALSVLIITCTLVPSCCFLAIAIRRMHQSFRRFRTGAAVIRRRFTRAHVMLLIMALLFTLSFQDITPIEDRALRQFFFVAAFVFMFMGSGYGYLAWNLWWQGQNVSVGRRWSDTRDPPKE